MIQTPQPHDKEVIALDRALDAIAGRRPSVADPALDALADLARAIDARAATVAHKPPAFGSATGANRPADHNGKALRPASTTSLTRPATGRHLRKASKDRKRVRRVATMIASTAAAITLFGALPINASPGSPLYPLHQLLVQDKKPSAADKVRLNLASARQVLDQTTASSKPDPAELDRARRLLAEARTELAQVSDPDTKSELSNELSDLEQRANRLAADQHGDGADTTSPEQNEQGQGGKGNIDPTHDPQNESGSTAGPTSTHDPSAGG
jgi:hypothetical protein